MKKKDTKWEVVEALFMVTQIGLSLILCMTISLFIGYWLDRLFHTRFIIVIMIFVGIGASIRSLLTLTRTFGGSNENKVEEKESGDSEEKPE